MNIDYNKFLELASEMGKVFRSDAGWDTKYDILNHYYTRLSETGISVSVLFPPMSNKEVHCRTQMKVVEEKAADIKKILIALAGE